jgi:uncharacterized membrane protein
MNSTQLFFTFAIVFVPVMLMQVFMPMLTRRTESFGVSIPSDQYQNSEIAAMRKKYVLSTVIVSVLTLVIMAFISKWAMAMPMMLFAYLIVSFFIYLRFHNRMKVYKQEQNWSESKKQRVVIDTTFRSRKLTHSNGWFVIGLLMTLATITVSLLMYDKIPAKIPMKYDFAGRVTKWADKSYRTVFLLPIIQFYMLGLFVFINMMISRAKAVIDPDAPEASIQKNQIFRRRWSAFSIGTGTAVILIMALEQATFVFDINPRILNAINLGLVAIIIIAAVILSFTTGQGGSRLKLAGKQDPSVINRDDDRYWKLGIFYVNSKDPALFVEKRFGIGWTGNFGHPLSFVIVGVIIVVIVAASLLGV